jgi:hypothetical protein
MASDLLDDFEEDCGHPGPLPRFHVRMRAVPCGRSFSENMEFGVYCEPPGRSATAYQYLGIYRNKAVRGVGRVVNRVQAKIGNDQFSVLRSEAPVTEEQEQRILQAVEAAADARGWDLRSGLEFVVLDRAHPTNFRKTSAGGLPGTRYFDLGDLLGTDSWPPTEELAAELDEMNWE